MKKKFMRRKRSEGSALVLVILLLSVLTVLISGLSTLTLSNYRTRLNEAMSHKAFYIAEACLEETRTRVVMRLQDYINQGAVNTYGPDFHKFLDSLTGLHNEVASDQVIESLGADSLRFRSEKGDRSILFFYTATVGGMTHTLGAEYIFDDPNDFSPDDLATNRVEILWIGR